MADPRNVATLDLRQLREIIPYLIRSERWRDMRADTGGGAISEFLERGAAKMFARRLPTFLRE